MALSGIVKVRPIRGRTNSKSKVKMAAARRQITTEMHKNPIMIRTKMGLSKGTATKIKKSTDAPVTSGTASREERDLCPIDGSSTFLICFVRSITSRPPNGSTLRREPREHLLRVCTLPSRIGGCNAPAVAEAF